MKDLMSRVEDIAHLFNARQQFADKIAEKALFRMDVDPNDFSVSWTEVNKALCDLLGYDSRDLIHRNWQSIICDPDQMPELRRLSVAIANTAPYESFQRVRHGETGQVIKIHVHAEPYVNKKEILECYFGVIELAP